MVKLQMLYNLVKLVDLLNLTNYRDCNIKEFSTPRFCCPFCGHQNGHQAGSFVEAFSNRKRTN